VPLARIKIIPYNLLSKVPEFFISFDFRLVSYDAYVTTITTATTTTTTTTTTTATTTTTITTVTTIEVMNEWLKLGLLLNTWGTAG